MRPKLATLAVICCLPFALLAASSTDGAAQSTIGNTMGVGSSIPCSAGLRSAAGQSGTSSSSWGHIKTLYR